MDTVAGEQRQQALIGKVILENESKDEYAVSNNNTGWRFSSKPTVSTNIVFCAVYHHDIRRGGIQIGPPTQ